MVLTQRRLVLHALAKLHAVDPEEHWTDREILGWLRSRSNRNLEMTTIRVARRHLEREGWATRGPRRTQANGRTARGSMITADGLKEIHG